VTRQVNLIHAIRQMDEMDLWSPLETYDADVPTAVTATRPLRADAERNRARILEAAAQVFAERGLAGTLHDVAEAAGLGVGTVYRRFPDKESLVEALFESEVDRIAEQADQFAREPDAWQALVGFLRLTSTEQAENRGLHEVLNSTGYGQDRVAASRARIMPTVAGMLTRAQEQGKARTDIEAADLGMLVMMVSSLAQFTQEGRNDAWVRYFELMIDSLRAQPGQTTLSVPALSDEELTCAMGHFKHRN
jgi:AcrR family transcriptional regulator